MSHRVAVRALTSPVKGREPSFMADIADFSIVTYERKPGCWPAAIVRKVSSGSVGGDKVRSVVTPDDCATEADAQLAAQKLIRKL